MKTVKSKPAKGSTILLIVVTAFLVLFILSFTLVGIAIGQSHNPEIKDFGTLMQYHFNGLKDLFAFKLNDASNVLYYDFSCFLYVSFGLWLIFLAIGLFFGIKRKRPVIAFGLAATFLAIVVFMFTVTGIPQYWLIVNQRYPYDNNNVFLLLFTFLTLLFSVLYIAMANIYYFVCLFDIYKNAKTLDEEAEEQPAVEEKKEVVIESAPKQEPVVEETKQEQVNEKEEQKDDSFSKKDLAELIRDIVREEVNRQAPNNPYPQGPLVVQYFGSVPTEQIVGQQKQQPLPKEETKQEAVAEVAPSDEVVVHENIVPEEEKAPEYIIVPEEKKEEPVKEQAKPQPKVEEPVEKKPIIRIPFYERMINADDEMKKNYNELKNEILSYGVNDRVSSSGDAFRLHRKTYVKITIAGLSLKLYFALNPDDYKDSPIPVQNAGHKGIYAEIPLVFKVKSGLSMRRAKELIQTVMEKDGFEQGVIENIDWVEKLKEQPVNDSDSED